MPRESADAKAKRLLGERRVIVLEAKGRYVRASVRGDSGALYVIEHTIDGCWVCPCEAMNHRSLCSHIRAVQHVVAPVRIAVAPARPRIAR